MKFLAIILLSVLFFSTALTQSTKPRSANPKPRAASEKTNITRKPKPVVTPLKRLIEQAEWDKANAAADPTAQVSALKKFIKTFPGSLRIAEASETISKAEAALGNEKLAAGDADSAIKLIRAAAADAPQPIPAQLFADTISKLPANLYFRGLRGEAIEVANIIEGKADTNAEALLTVANFYLSIENGSAARRVAEIVIKIDPNSSAAYRTRALANRVDFRLEESEADYAKALELEPESLDARRGLAETKRSLGKASEAVVLYREILAKDEASIPARTGLILALFDAEGRADAEAAMTESLEANPGNVILLAGAAYWYAAHNEGKRAVSLAQKAIDADPRFIWSHIAMARGLLNQNQPSAAEKTLLAARQYGNFPTLEYEIASVRLEAGLYREAAEELSKSFSVEDGVISVHLGGRVRSEAKDFAELIAPERKASLFAAMAADNAENAAHLKALLVFSQELKATEPITDIATSSADDFVRGDDRMKVHRQIFAASELLDKKIALAKVIELARAAPSNLEAGLDTAEPAMAVMASELYENRAIAAAGGQYINVPGVARPTLSAVLRGRIEDIAGWAAFQMDDAAQAVVHLKRAVGVLPVDSAWWRSCMWRLGTALAANGNEMEALEAYITSYKRSVPDPIRYGMIESLYKRVKGNTLGLQERIGPDSSLAVRNEPIGQKVEAAGEKVAEVGKTPETAQAQAATLITAPRDVPVATPASAGETRAPETPAPSPTSEEPKQMETPVDIPQSTSEPTPELQKTSELKSQDGSIDKASVPAAKELFPPVVITIPSAQNPKSAGKTEAGSSAPSQGLAENALPDEPKPTPTPEIKPCILTASEERVTLKNTDGISAVIIGSMEDIDLDGLRFAPMNPEDVIVRREAIEGVKTRALFVLRSTSAKTGDYKVVFEMPCGRKEITAKVQ